MTPEQFKKLTDSLDGIKEAIIALVGVMFVLTMCTAAGIGQ